jgi:hypothetical protein
MAVFFCFDADTSSGTHWAGDLLFVDGGFATELEAMVIPSFLLSLHSTSFPSFLHFLHFLHFFLFLYFLSFLHFTSFASFVPSFRALI